MVAGDDSLGSGVCSTVVKVMKGDAVWARNPSWASATDKFCWMSSFSGHLIHAD